MSRAGPWLAGVGLLLASRPSATRASETCTIDVPVDCVCPLGSSLAASGATAACQPCTSGFFSASEGNEPCASCASHWGDSYRSASPEEATSAEQCECMAGGLQLLEHAGTTRCRCPPGQEMVVIGDNANCEPCGPGTFSDAPGNEECVSCFSHHSVHTLIGALTPD
jgi:hypothetical protein